MVGKLTSPAKFIFLLSSLVTTAVALATLGHKAQTTCATSGVCLSKHHVDNSFARNNARLSCIPGTPIVMCNFSSVRLTSHTEVKGVAPSPDKYRPQNFTPRGSECQLVSKSKPNL